MSNGPFDEATARAMMQAAGPMRAGPAMQWRPRGNQTNYRVCATTLHDAAGVSVPGMTLQLEVRRPARVGDCYFMFGVYLSTRAGRWRVLQIEVYPANKPSHRCPDGTVLHGPHLHWGEDGFTIVDTRLHCDDWAGSLAVFTELASISNVNVPPP